MEPADWHVRAKMTKPQQVLEIWQERLAEETPEGSSADSSASVRKSPGGEPWGNDHLANIRLSIPLLFNCYYVTIVTGKERRSRERRAIERTKHPLVKFGNVVVIVACEIICGLGALYMLWLAMAYFLLR